MRELTATLLLFVAAYNLLDATQMIYVGALKGAGDTQFLLQGEPRAGDAAGRLQLSQRGGLETERVRLLDAHRVLVPDCGSDVLRSFPAGQMATMRVIEPDVSGVDATLGAASE